MRAVAPKRARQLRLYRPLRDAFLAANPRCAFPGGCVQPSTDLHHRAGRRGLMLLDVTRWSALCRSHHSFLTEHPTIAYEMGMSERRIGESG